MGRVDLGLAVVGYRRGRFRAYPWTRTRRPPGRSGPLTGQQQAESEAIGSVVRFARVVAAAEEWALVALMMAECSPSPTWWVKVTDTPLEPGVGQAILVLAPGQGAGDAADPGAPLGTVGGREVVLGDHIGDADAAARLEHAEGLGEHGWLVGGEVDHAVRDDHVDRVGGQGDGLDLALEELDVGGAGLGGVGAGQGQHLLGHVQPVGLAGGADPPGAQEHVDPAARAQVQDGLALVELGHRGGVAAAQAGQQRGVGELVAVQGGIELGAEPGLLSRRGTAAAAAVTAAVGRLPTPTVANGDLGRGGGVAGPDLLAQGVLVGVPGGHRLAPWRSRAAARPPRASGRRE